MLCREIRNTMGHSICVVEENELSVAEPRCTVSKKVYFGLISEYFGTQKT